MTTTDALVSPAGERGRRSTRRAASTIGLFVFLVLAAVVTACGSSPDLSQSADRNPHGVAASEPASPETTAAVSETSGAAESTAPPQVDPPATAVPAPTPTPHPIAAADTELPRAPVGFDDVFNEAPSGPQPISITIDDISVEDAVVTAVGVNEDLSFEVPPADQVGWYEFGALPGEEGSAVLAAHIAYNGIDGVFRYLEDVEVGAVVTIGFADGSRRRYRIQEVTEYVKEDLPESLFERAGKEQLALITCGGNFNYQLESYESNTVAIAVPI